MEELSTIKNVEDQSAPTEDEILDKIDRETPEERKKQEKQERQKYEELGESINSIINRESAGPVEKKFEKPVTQINLAEQEKKMWQAIEQKHGFNKKIIKELPSYLIKRLKRYLAIKDEVDTSFNFMVADKKLKNQGKKNNYSSFRQAWIKAKKELRRYQLEGMQPEEIMVIKNAADFVRKYNLGKLSMDHNSLLLKELKAIEAQRKFERKIERAA